MRLRTDERGVTVQIGTVLLFAVLIILLSTYQATVVPQQNEQVEFNHNQQVQGQLQDLRDELRRTAVTGSGGSTSVALGTRYSVRAVFVNPAPPSGTLRTTSPANVTLLNATATGETGDYWDGSARNFSTRGLAYDPIYHVYQNSPTTIYDNGVLYNRFDGANRTLAGQRLVRGNRISLVAVNGSLSESGSGSATVDFEAVSPATRTVTVRNESAEENVTVVVPTNRDAAEWEELLENELDEDEDDPDKHVKEVTDATTTDGRNAIELVLEPGVYELELAKVGVGSDVTGVEPQYVTDVRGDNASVSANATRKLVVEVRDRYNNPVSGARVNLSVVDNYGKNGKELPDRLHYLGESGETLTGLATDSQGRVEVRYEVDEFNGANRQVGVRASVAESPSTDPDEPFAAGTRENLTFGLTVYSTGPGNGGGGGGGNDDGTLPNNAKAYDDANGNGQYDDGEETYTEGNLREFNRSGVDLVIAEAVETNKMNVNANTVTVEADVSVTGRNHLALTVADGRLRVEDGVKLSAQRVMLYGEQLTLDGSVVEAGSDGIELAAEEGSGGPISAVDAKLETGGGVALISVGDVDLTRASIEAGGQATADLNDKEYVLTVTDARLLDSDETLVYDPNNAEVDGSPAEGNVSSN